MQAAKLTMASCCRAEQKCEFANLVYCFSKNNNLNTLSICIIHPAINSSLDSSHDCLARALLLRTSRPNTSSIFTMAGVRGSSCSNIAACAAYYEEIFPDIYFQLLTCGLHVPKLCCRRRFMRIFPLSVQETSVVNPDRPFSPTVRILPATVSPLILHLHSAFIRTSRTSSPGIHITSLFISAGVQSACQENSPIRIHFEASPRYPYGTSREYCPDACTEARVTCSQMHSSL